MCSTAEIATTAQKDDVRERLEERRKELALLEQQMQEREQTLPLSAGLICAGWSCGDRGLRGH